MRILVTGASGLLGFNLAWEWALKHTVFGVVNSQPLNLARLPSDRAFTQIQADLLDGSALERVLDQAQPDWIVHCAALANLEACQTEPVLARHVNTVLPGMLAQYVARGGARLLHISTDAVFDGQRGFYREDDPTNPLSVYAQTKLDGEFAVAAANPQAIIARVNLFGWSVTGKRSLAEFFFNNLQTGKQMMGFTDIFFCPTLVNTLAAIIEKMFGKELSGLFHLVGSEHLSKYDFGVAIARQFDLDADLIRPASVTEAGLAAARSPKLILDSSRLAAALAEPLPRFSPMLTEFYTLYQQGYPQMLKSLLV